MKALRSVKNAAVVVDLEKPAQQGEALVRVLRSGICSTDLEIIKGYAGFEGTIGHEFVGIVEDAGGRPELLGKRVVGEINAGCGVCQLCLAGDARHCDRRTVLGIKGRDGAHAEFLKLPAGNLIEVPDNVSTNAAVFAEPLAAAIGISEQVELGPETNVAVIGDGKLGLLISFAMKLFAENTMLVGKHREKLKLAAARGIEGLLVEDTGLLARQFDVVVEASGAESGFASALDLVRPRGKIVLKSTFIGKPGWEAWRVVVDEISVIGSRCGRLLPALTALSSGRVAVEDLISDEFRLTDGVAAVDRASQRGVLKVLLNMEQ